MLSAEQSSDSRCTEAPASGADFAHLRRAVSLSLSGMRTSLGGPFGAVVVSPNGTVLAEASNEVTSSNDPTAHAEIVAIRRACKAAGSFELEGATVYASCEPCPMCLAACYWARVARIVFANTREDAAGAGFSDAEIYEEVGKEPDERKVKGLHVELKGAGKAFEEWKEKEDRVRY
ncbi:cytosine/adenosine deaminase [Hyaloraphidium curvatum]|nr:cytosine/adenosine deaminase [Hyaloraphidium curvatum]